MITILLMIVAILLGVLRGQLSTLIGLGAASRPQIAPGQMLWRFYAHPPEAWAAA